MSSGRPNPVHELRILRCDGGERLVECLALPIAFEGKPAVVCVFHDVTDQRRAQAAQQHLAAVVETTADAIVTTKLDGTILTWNGGAETLYQCTADEVLGRPLWFVIPPERTDSEALRRRVAAGEVILGYETTHVRKDGSRVDVSLTISPLRDANGVVTGMASIVRDVSERKRTQARLLLADRMISLGTMAAGVAHEINNPLAFVLTNLSLADEYLSSGSRLDVDAIAQLRDAIADARVGGERVRAIVRDIRSLSRSDDSTESAVELAPVLMASVHMVSNEIRHSATLQSEIGQTPRVLANEARLGQVFLNLLLNAVHAVSEAKGERQVAVRTYTDASGRAVVEISDTGTGIAPNVLQRIFDPFFTTKAVGVGTGLGLSICHSIVTALGGSISVESAVGQGSTFRVTLPPAPNDAPVAAAGPPAGTSGGDGRRVPDPDRRRGRILVVDDEPMVGRAVQRLLGRDHDVLTTTRAKDALGRLGTAGPFDVILTDLMMPEMSGMEFFEAVSATFPELVQRMIFLTGGAFTPAAQSFLDRVSNPRLDKPFELRALGDLVRSYVPAR